MNGTRLSQFLWVGVVATIAACGAGDPASPARPGPRNVVLLILDTTRADHLGAYGYDRPTSPHLDQLAREGELYTRAYSVSPWTLPAIATILTGRPPWEHGAGVAANGYHAIRDEVATVAEIVAAAGVETAAFANVIFFRESLGMARGFRHFDRDRCDDLEQSVRNAGNRTAEETTDAVLRWARKRPAGAFFLVVHYFDPHLTYAAPEELVRIFDPQPVPRIGPDFGTVAEMLAIREGTLQLSDRQRETLVARYDAEIRFMDEHIGRLRSGLEKLGVWRDSLVIVVGDHGEEFFDHGGFEHGHSHYAELMRVPLIVRSPDGPTGLRHELIVQPSAIAATVLEFLGVPAPESMSESLRGHPEDVALAFGSLWSTDLVSVRSTMGTAILQRDVIGASVEFYAAADSTDRVRLPATSLPGAADLLDRLRSLPPSRRVEPGDWTPFSDEIEQLRALGYIR